MEPAHFPVLGDLFRVIEERIPGGRIITTLAALLVVLAVILLAASYLLSVFLSIGFKASIVFASLSSAIHARTWTSWFMEVFPYLFAVSGMLLGGMIIFIWFASLRQSQQNQLSVLDRIERLERTVSIKKDS